MFTSIANIFSPKASGTPVAPAGAPAAPVAQAPANPMAQNNPTAGATTPPASGQSQPTLDANGQPVQQQQANPLDAFQTIWQTPTADGKTPPVDPFTQPLLNSDPSKIAAAAGKINVLQNIPQDLMAKAASGQDPAAFAQVIQAAVQAGIATAAQLTTATVEQATAMNNQRVLNALPDRVNKINLSQMAPENPMLAHPAVQPMLQMAKLQIAQNNPGMSAQEVAKQAEAYMTTFASAINPGQAGQSQQQGNGQPGQQSNDPDWGQLLGV